MSQVIRCLSVVSAMLAVGVAPAAAQAPGAVPPGHTSPGGLEITSVDGAARTITGVQHCVAPHLAGQSATFAVAPAVDMSFMAPGIDISVVVDPLSKTIVRAADQPCRGPGPPGAMPPNGPNGGPGPVPGGPGGAAHPHGGPEGMPEFESGFLNKVWRFQVDVDGFSAGKLSVTVGKILNLPKKFAEQDDELLDQDALVLVGSARIYERGERVKGKDLDDAESAIVRGKLLAAAKWQDDEDGSPVPTIRAKRIEVVK